MTLRSRLGVGPAFGRVAVLVLVAAARVASAGGPEGSAGSTGATAVADAARPAGSAQARSGAGGGPADAPRGASVDPALDRVMNAADRRHLLLRSGIGAAPADLLALEGMTRAEGVAHVIDGLATVPSRPMPAWTREPPPHYHAREDMSEREGQRFDRERGRELAALRGWWIDEMLAGDSPQTERLVLFWHDLFATSYHGTDRASLAMARQNATFRRLATGSWETLLHAMLRDAALLDYLDAGSNRAGSPNENLAREFLELFTLGEGHYTERDVAEAARALTGHATSDTRTLAFRLHTWNQDTGDKTLFGTRGAHDGDALVRLVLAQPAAARHLATRFWRAFVADGPPTADWLDAVSARFRASGHDLATLYRDTLSSAAFWSAGHRGAMVRSPLDLVVGTARSLDYPKRDAHGFAALLDTLGMSLFAPPDVAGWREGDAFVAGGALLDRRRAIERIVGGPEGPAPGGGAPDDGKSRDGTNEAKGGVASAAVPGMSGAPGAPGASGASVGTSIEASGAMSGDMSGTLSVSSGRGGATGERTYPDAPLVIRLAAEHYRGPAVWRVSLREGDRTLWTDRARVLGTGHDTERDGRLDVGAGLPWRRVPVPAPAALLARADAVAVEFLADFAGPTGDRNLYVDGAIVDGAWLDASDGVQRGECVPEDPLAAGFLYCGGTLVMPRPGVPADVQPGLSDAAWRAGAVHVRWANADGIGGRDVASIALDDVVTPRGDFHRVQFRLVALADGPVEIEIDAFDCVPDCIAPWPDCAWRDERFPRVGMLAFPLDGRATSAREPCHVEGVDDDTRALVATLARSAGPLLERLVTQPSGVRHADTLRRIGARLADADVGTGERFVVDDTVRPPSPIAASGLPAPAVLAATPAALVAALEESGLGLVDVMLAGLPDDVLAPLAPRPDERAAEAIGRIARHPAFQLR